MHKELKEFIIIFIVLVLFFLLNCKKVYAENFSDASKGLSGIGREYEIGYLDLKNNENLNCVAKGQNLKDGKDTYIVDSTLCISAGSFSYRYIFPTVDCGEVKISNTDKMHYTGDIKNMYKLQYILCNNTYNYGRGYLTQRQNVVWKNWNDCADNLIGIMYRSDAIYAIDKVTTNDTEESYNLDNEASIYSDILNKNKKSVKADIKIVEQKEWTNCYSIKFRYSGIITGIYNGSHEAIKNIYENSDKTKKIELVDLSVGDGTTEKTIYIDKEEKNIRFQVASTDTTLYIWHLQNESIYKEEQGKDCPTYWAAYTDTNMGQDLIASYFTKSDDITKNVSFDGSSGGGSGGGSNITIITTTTTKCDFHIKKIDADTKNPIPGVSIFLSTKKEGGNDEFKYELTTGDDGKVNFIGFDVPLCYNVWEENNNSGYNSGRIYVGQISIDEEGNCKWNVQSGNVAGYGYEDGGVFVIKNKKKTGSITITKQNIGGDKNIARNIF